MMSSKRVFPAPVAGARLTIWLVGAVFVAALAWLWPTRVIVRNDDFGYIESVAETIRRGALASSDWVEPLNFILPLLSAGIWRLGDSFYLATMGLMAAMALVNFVLLWLWLRPMVPTGWAGHVSLLAVALFPTWLNKTVEYTGVSLGYSLVLGALLAWRSRKPAWFFVLVMAGCLNRQSAICLLALPAFEQFCVRRRGSRLDWRWIAGGLGAAAVFGIVMTLAPQNLSRTLTARRQEDFNLIQFGGQSLLGLGLFGAIAAGWAWLRGASPLASMQQMLTKPGVVIAWLLIGAIIFAADVTPLRCETPWLWRFGPVVVFAAVVLAAAIPKALGEVAPEALVAVGVYGLIVSWRGVWWDYYLCEPAMLLAMTRVRRGETSGPGLGALVASGVGLGVALLWLFPLKQQLRWSEVRVVAYEQALRTGQIAITEASEAPFGFLGWKVFPALSEHAAEPELRLSDFVKFIETGRSYYLGGAIVVVQPEPVQRSLHGSGLLWSLPDDYRPRRFPLNDKEWRDWLAAPGL